MNKITTGELAPFPSFVWDMVKESLSALEYKPESYRHEITYTNTVLDSLSDIEWKEQTTEQIRALLKKFGEALGGVLEIAWMLADTSPLRYLRKQLEEHFSGNSSLEYLEKQIEELNEVVGQGVAMLVYARIKELQEDTKRRRRKIEIE